MTTAYETVLYSVARHARIPEVVGLHLAALPVWSPQHMLGWNPFIGPNVLDVLARNPYSGTQLRVCAHPNTRLQTLQHLATSEYPVIRTAATRACYDRCAR